MTRRVAGGLIAGVIACGAFGEWLVFASELKVPAIDRAVGATAMVACVLAAIALLRRSWARVPLVGVCVIAGLLTKSALFDPYDPSDLTGFEYFATNVLIIIASSVAFFISLAENRIEPLP